MILFDNIIQVLALANLDTFVFVTVVLFDRCSVGTTFINIDETRFSVSTDGFGQKASHRLRVTLGRQQKIYSVAVLVDSTVKIFPCALNLHVGLVQPPTHASSFLVTSKCLFNARRVVNDSALYRTVIDRVASFLHQFFQVAIAQSVGHIPTHAL